MTIILPQQKIEWNVADLGTATGWLNADGSTQFFGVPYADIPARFRQSVLRTSWADGKLDCTMLRGYCPQPPRVNYPFLIPDRPHAGGMYIDEFDCLNLQITVPAGTQSTDKLPVLLYIHGGAFVAGTGNYSILDGKHLAAKSKEAGLPTIIVSCNYRCGFFGFLCSSDIEADNKAHSAGVGNYGLHDQKNAFLWINKFISGFGGDPERVTVAGQSAGGASMDVHMQSPYNHLFANVILMSGTAPICGIYTPAEYEILYRKLLTHLGISLDLAPEERLRQLRAVTHEAISIASFTVFQGLNTCQFGISTDLSMLAEGFKLPTPAQYPTLKVNYAGRIMLGDCLHEGIIYAQCYTENNGDRAINLIRRHLDEPFASIYIDHYGIKSGMTVEEVSPLIERSLTDSTFTSLPHYIAQANPDTTFAYHFDQLSTLNNCYQGTAHHSLDYMFVFGNINFQLDEKQIALVNQMGIDFIRFAHGQEPYPSIASGQSRLYGPDSQCSLGASPRDTAWFEELAPHMDALLKLAADFNVRQSELLSPNYGPGSQNQRDIPQLGKFAMKEVFQDAPM